MRHCQCIAQHALRRPPRAVRLFRRRWVSTHRGIVHSRSLKRLFWGLGGALAWLAYCSAAIAWDRSWAPHDESRIVTSLEADRAQCPTPLALLRRGLWLLWSFSAVLLSCPLALLFDTFREGIFFALIENAIRHSRSAALTKWSQWASVRYDIFPCALCDRLARLQAAAPTHSLEHTLQELRHAGFRVEDASPVEGEERVLHGLEEVPLGSGAIAQVHAATLNGRRVAVKVRHPRVREEYLLDFELLRGLASLVHSWVPQLRCFNAPETVNQFEDCMGQQCDLSEEGRNLLKFGLNFRRKRRCILFPEVILASSAVLVETFEAGDLMSIFTRRWRDRRSDMTEEDLQQAQFVIQRGEDCYFQMLLVDNFLHADLHPGNILYRRLESGQQQIVVLDAGMAHHLTAEERAHYIGFMQGVTDGNTDVIVDHLLCFSSGQAMLNISSFRSDISKVVHERCRGYGYNIRCGEVVREMMKLMYQHGVAIDGNYAALVVNCLCLEGLVNDLDPSFNVIDASYPLLRTHQYIGDANFHTFFSWVELLTPQFVMEPMMEAFYSAMLHLGYHGEVLRKQL